MTMNEQNDGLRVSVSVSRKVNLGNYQSADVFFAISGIEIGASAAELAAAVETGEIAFGVVDAEIQKKVRGILEQQQQARERATAAVPERAVPQRGA